MSICPEKGLTFIIPAIVFAKCFFHILITFQCYEKYNKPLADGSVREYPLCAVELKDAMSGAKDSRTCYRRTQVPTNLNPDTYCDPLGDDNVIATIKAVPNNEPYPSKSVIVAAARVCISQQQIFFTHYFHAHDFYELSKYCKKRAQIKFVLKVNFTRKSHKICLIHFIYKKNCQLLIHILLKHV